MKKFTLRSCVALACAIGLSACGGGSDNLLLQVAVYGVTKDGLTLTNNGGTPVAVPAGTTVVNFPNIGSDSNFDIEIATPVSNASCTLENNKGKTTSFSPIGIRLICIAYTYDLGGKIKGLTGDGLILINGADKKTFNHGTTADFDFNMTIAGTTTGTGTSAVTTPDTGKVAESKPYGVLIFQQPSTGNCVIDKRADGTSTGVGTMPAHAITGTKPDNLPVEQFDPILITCS
jgi:hypothetical protein